MMGWLLRLGSCVEEVYLLKAVRVLLEAAVMAAL